MRRTKSVGVAALVATLMLVGASPVTAAGVIKASLEVTWLNVIGDPEAVAGRCGPEVPQVIVRGAGTGELTSEVYTGPIGWVEEHCTVGVDQASAGVLVDRIHTAFVTISTPGGEFSYAYEATGVFTGVYGIVPWRHTGEGPYTITGGSGIFDGATGHGHLSVLDDSGDISIDLNGSLAVPS